MALAVHTTLDDEDAALALARSIVEAGLAACVHVERITSVYRWDGVQQGPEWRLMIKCPGDGYDALAAHVLAAHPYDEPALWALPIAQGAASFLDWVERAGQ